MPASLTPSAATDLLRRGGVIAYPTEAVWGLGCDPFDETAVLRLLALKQRAVDKGLILIAASASQFDGLLDWNALPEDRRAAVHASWPGPHTWIVPATPSTRRGVPATSVIAPDVPTTQGIASCRASCSCTICQAGMNGSKR